MIKLRRSYSKATTKELVLRLLIPLAQITQLQNSKRSSQRIIKLQSKILPWILVGNKIEHTEAHHISLQEERMAYLEAWIKERLNLANIKMIPKFKLSLH